MMRSSARCAPSRTSTRERRCPSTSRVSQRNQRCTFQRRTGLLTQTGFWARVKFCECLRAVEGGETVTTDAPSSLLPGQEVSLLKFITEFEYKEEVEMGTLVIRPLSSEWIPKVAQLLAKSFSETLGYSETFRWWLRKQVTDYLETCLKVPPAGTVLIAILKPNAEFDIPEEALVLAESPSKFQGFKFDASSVPDEFKMDTPVQPLTAPFNISPADLSEKGTVFRGFRDDLDDLGNLDQDTESVGSQASDSTDDSTDDVTDDVTASDDNGEEVESKGGFEMPEVQEVPENVMNGVDRIQSDLDTEGNSVGGQEDGAGEVEEKVAKPTVLLGTVELSLEASSRSFYFFLNPPQDSAYICNMAVDGPFTRQGHATRLLNAAEEIAKYGDHKDMYLHLRFADTGAGKLYNKNGFVSEKKDNIFWSILGLERKYLMKKDLH